MDRTLILVKPDAFARGLTGEIIARFERKGLRIVALKHMTVTEDAGQAALRRARGQAVLRRAGRVHHLRPARRDGARGRRGGHGRAPGDRRDEPARGRPGLDPRRLRDRGRPEHGPRLGLAGVGRARGRRCSSRTSDSRLAPRRSGARSSTQAASRSRCGRPTWTRTRRATRAAVAEGTPAARRCRGRPATLVLGADTVVALDGEILGKPRDAAQAREYVGAPQRAHARGRRRDRARARRRDRRRRPSRSRA